MSHLENATQKTIADGMLADYSSSSALHTTTYSRFGRALVVAGTMGLVIGSTIAPHDAAAQQTLNTGVGVGGDGGWWASKYGLRGTGGGLSYTGTGGSGSNGDYDNGSIRSGGGGGGAGFWGGGGGNASRDSGGGDAVPGGGGGSSGGYSGGAGRDARWNSGKSGAGGGGGGGSHGYYGNSLPYSASGGNGGRGGNAEGDPQADFYRMAGGGGGGGGFGAIVTGFASGTISSITGGHGGNGGSSYSYGQVATSVRGSEGGGGGHALYLNGSGANITNVGTIAGGNGGSAGWPSSGGDGEGQYMAGGSAGGGIIGTSLSAATIIQNNGIIKSGTPGTGYPNGSNNYPVYLTSSSTVEIYNAGSIQLPSSSSSLDAVYVNAASGSRYEIQGTGSQNGRVRFVGGGTQTLALGGSIGSTFNLNQIGSSYQGFNRLEKVGTSTWNVTGSNTQDWNVYQGVLNAQNSVIGGNVRLRNGTTVRFTNSSDLTYGRTISNETGHTTGSVEKAGSGVLSFNSFQNYTGATLVTAGTLQLLSNGAIDSSSSVTLNGGSLDISTANGARTVNNFSGNSTSSTVTLGIRNLTIIGNGSATGTTYAGTFSRTGTSNRVIFKTGKLTLTNNSPAVPFTIEGDATLQVGNGGTSGSVGDVLLDGGDATLRFNRANALTYTGNISGNGTLIQAGPTNSIITLAGNYSSLTGKTEVLSGTLTLAAPTGRLDTTASVSGNGRFNVNGIVERHATITGNGVLSISDTLGTSGRVNGGATVSGNGQLLVNTGGILSGNSTVSSTGHLKVDGSVVGDVDASGIAARVSGAGLITGNVNISAGGLLTPGNTEGATINPGTLTIDGNLTLANGSSANFQVKENGRIGGANNDLVDVKGTLTLGNTSILNVNAESAGYYRLFTVADDINGTFGTVNATIGGVASIGTVYFNNPDPKKQVNIIIGNVGEHFQFWDGTDTLTEDAGIRGGDGVWGGLTTNWVVMENMGVNAYWANSSAVFDTVGGTVQIDGVQSFNTLQFKVDGYHLTPHSSGGGLKIGVASGSTINVDAATATTRISAVIENGVGFDLTKVGAGKLTLEAENAYTGATAINNGTLALVDAGAISTSSGVDVKNTATFDIAATTNGATITKLTGEIGSKVVLDAKRLTISNADGTYSGIISGTSGVSIDAGSQIFDGLNTYTGQTEIASGVSLSLQGGVSNDATFVSDIDVGGTLNFNRADNWTYANVLTGAGTVNKNNANILYLTNDSSAFAGQTNVNAGQLRVNNNLGGNVDVFTNATLGGNGTIGGNVVVHADGSLAPGNSPGTLSINGNLTLNTGSNSVFEFNSPTVVGGVSNDLVIVKGNLTLGGALQVTAASAGYYRLFDGIEGTISGAFSSVTTQIGADNPEGIVYVNRPGAAQQVNLLIVGAGQEAQFWDGTDTLGNGTVDGGAGTWSDGYTNWAVDPTKGVNTYWRSSLAIFDTVGGAISVVGTQKFDTLQFNVNNYALNGGSLEFDKAAGGTINVAATVRTDIASSLIDGLGSNLIKVGTGTLALSGANTYTGITRINEGELALTGGGSVATSSEVVLQANTVLSINETTAGASIQKLTSSSASSSTVLGAQRLTITNANTTFSGAITGTGGVSITGGTQALNGLNDYTGSTLVSSGATLRLTGGTFTSDVDVAGTVDFDRSTDWTYGNALTGAGIINKEQNTKLTFTGNSAAFAGTTNVNMGHLVLDGNLGGNAVVSDSELTVNATRTLGGNITATDSTLLINGIVGGNIDATDTDVTVNGRVSGYVRMTGNLLDITGQIVGSVAIDNGASLTGYGQIDGNLNVNTGGRLDPDNQPNLLSVGGNVILAAGSASVFNYSAGSSTYVDGRSDRVTVGGNLSLGGTLDVNAASAGYYRLFTVTGGTVSGTFATTDVKIAGTAAAHNYYFNSPGAAKQVNLLIFGADQDVQLWDGTDELGNGSITGGNGTWQAGASNWTIEDGFQVNTYWRNSVAVFDTIGGTVSVVGKQSFDTLQFNVTGYSFTPGVGGQLEFGVATGGVVNVGAAMRADVATPFVDGAGSALSKVGAGTLALGGVNAYTGLTEITGGTLALTGTGSILSSSEVILDTGTVFAINETTAGASVKKLTTSHANTSTNLGAQRLTITNASTTFSGVITGTGGVSILAGTQTLNGLNDYTGQTRITSAARLNVTGGSFVSNVDVLGTGALHIDRTDNWTYANTLTGNGIVNKDNTNRVYLTGNSEYFAGTTNINAGHLTVNGTLGGDVNVKANTTLSGIGRILGNVDVQANAILSPADTGRGTLSIGGNLTLGSSATTRFEVGSSTIVGGSDNDLIVVNGNLSLAGTLQVSAASAGYYRLFDQVQGTISGAFNTIQTQIGTDPATSNGIIYYNKPGHAQQVNLLIVGDNQNIQFWDGSDTIGDSFINGGSGVWADGSTNWAIDPSHQVNTYWRNSVAVFESIGGDVTVVGTQKFDTLQFNVTDYILKPGSGGQLELATATGATINVAYDVQATLETPIVNGLGSNLTKVGAGKLVLTGVNAYTGATLLNNGTLALSGTGSVANSSEVVMPSSSVFDIAATTSGATIQKLTGVSDARVLLGAQRLTINNAGGVFSGAITGTGGVTIAAGSQTFDGMSDFTGSTHIASGATLSLKGGTFTSDIEVASSAVLNFDRTSDWEYVNSLTGTGVINKNNTSALNLTGDSSGFSGVTNVNRGYLAVNGRLGGDVLVHADATLGGAGIINGNARILQDGTLAPGNSPGTLTITGNLTLDSGSTTVFELNSPTFIADDNDLIIIGNDLKLGGTLVAHTQSAGYYRLFNVGGNLSGEFDTLDIRMSGGAATGKTYINVPGHANQVNLLVYGEGQALQFWDGHDTQGDGKVAGGDGLWNSTRTNWTSVPGSEVNSSWRKSVGIFETVGGKVTVEGKQTFDTLQFNVDDYVITPASSGGELGFSTADGGIINVMKDVTTRLEASLVDDVGKSFEKKGAGTLVMASESRFSGRTVVSDGTLRQGIQGAFNTSSSGFDVGANGFLDIGDFDTTISSLKNAGKITIGNTQFTTLTVNGDYEGAGGLITMHTQLSSDRAASDVMKILGNSSGHTNIMISNRSGTGVQTEEGIVLVSVDGTSAGSFSLVSDYVNKDGDKAIVAGAFSYSLYQGSVSAPSDGNWYLRSNGINPGVPLYEGGTQSMQELNQLPTLQQRIKSRINGSSSNSSGNDSSDGASGTASETSSNREELIWARIEGSHNRFTTGNTLIRVDQKTNMFVMQAGIDGQFYDGDEGQLILGISGQYSRARSTTISPGADGVVKTQGWGVGASATWYGTNGFYMDAQAQATRYINEYESVDAKRSVGKDDGAYGYAVSVEAGQKLDVNNHWSFTPQIQLAWSKIGMGNFNDVWGTPVEITNGQSLVGRAGLGVDYNNGWRSQAGDLRAVNVYGNASIFHEFMGNMGLSVGDASINDVDRNFGIKREATFVGLGVGGSYSWNNSKHSVFGEASYTGALKTFTENYTLRGAVGFRTRW